MEQLEIQNEWANKIASTLELEIETTEDEDGEWCYDPIDIMSFNEIHKFISQHINDYLLKINADLNYMSEKQKNFIAFIECNSLIRFHNKGYRLKDSLGETKDKFFGNATVGGADVFIKLYKDIANDKYHNGGGKQTHKQKEDEAMEMIIYISKHSEPSDYGVPNH